MTLAITKTYVRYFMPGAFVPEEGTREVPERNPYEIARELPADVFAFEFFEKIAMNITLNESGDREQLASGERNRSGRFYIDAEKLTASDVEALPGDHRILLSNMRGNGWDTILRCRTGNFQPPLAEDSIVTVREASR